ncbi:MAG: lipoate--protein ligase family protein [Nitrospirae bacterium]|nr:lipoate--protein ligase family protein [Nitrospirota bacterium]
MIWRLFDYKILDASQNMTIDQEIADEVIYGDASALRFYGWNVPSVTLGYFQKESGINIDYCKDNSIPVVKRPTGGRAVLHDNELTYSFASGINDGIFTNNLLDNYHKLSDVFKTAFSEIGLEVVTNDRRKNRNSASPLCFDSPSFGEMTASGKKIIGSAQRRYQGGYFLQQGSIPLTINRELMSRVFNFDHLNALRGLGAQPTTNNPFDSMAGINELIIGITKENLMDAIIRAFKVLFHVEFQQADLPRF